ncbi:hypothetical protein SAMN05661091_3889 [Paenibacillus uliginis N3/975]|uniref:Uncharacterized protein n=1 Tax=Paenibacillus uliginis N3/975 TaxID=1313296 RepID=A0A1X7HJJ1_9BACL|nr:hypothetical protein [Paenibacillus uliginis]SMF87743.1 hypothetical protein SAMN05661091_3889 [Paenibacillus uliginis N3/975]
MMKSPLLPPVPTEEDDLLVRSYVVHGIMLKMLRRDIDTLHTLSLKMPTLYIRSLGLIEKETSRNLWSVRQRLRVHGIRISEETRKSGGIEAVFMCRGYHRTLWLSWELIQKEAMNRLHRYSGSNLAAY